MIDSNYKYKQCVHQKKTVKNSMPRARSVIRLVIIYDNLFVDAIYMMN